MIATMESAEIALQQVAEIIEILLPDRLVEAVFLNFRLVALIRHAALAR
jgi:hypothetical protein